MSGSGLAAVLRKHINLVNARTICLNSVEGTELLSETRAGHGTTEDSGIVAALVPSFSSSNEQAHRLGLGAPKMSVTWAANSIIVQSTVNASVIISIICEENVNLGLVKENMVDLQNKLRQTLS